MVDEDLKRRRTVDDAPTEILSVYTPHAYVGVSTWVGVFCPLHALWILDLLYVLSDKSIAEMVTVRYLSGRLVRVAEMHN